MARERLDDKAKAAKLFEQGLSYAEIGRKLGRPRCTVWQWLSPKYREYREKNSKRIKETCRDYYEANRDYIRELQKDYGKKNRAGLNEYKNGLYATDIQNKLRCLLRTRLNAAIDKDSKAGSAVQDLGCSIAEFKLYIESLFGPGMSWGNHGEWHLDHVIPLSSFDLTNRRQFLKACHFTNYQPLWATDNLQKGNRGAA